jgi:plastocyanin
MHVKRATMCVVVPVVALVLVASGCGSDSPDTDAGAAGASTASEVDSTVPDVGASSTSPVDGDVTVEANGEVVDVVALDNTFRPEEIEVTAGTEIRWENRGRNDHDVVPADEALGWGVDASGFAPGDEYSWLFDTPGEYRYYCSIHGTADVGMIGKIVVVAPDA